MYLDSIIVKIHQFYNKSKIKFISLYTFSIFNYKKNFIFKIRLTNDVFDQYYSLNTSILQ
jgi:hypothetical protein